MLESIRGFSFFFKKTKFEVQVFSVKKLEPRIESFRFGRFLESIRGFSFSSKN